MTNWKVERTFARLQRKFRRSIGRWEPQWKYWIGNIDSLSSTMYGQRYRIDLYRRKDHFG